MSDEEDGTGVVRRGSRRDVEDGERVPPAQPAPVSEGRAETAHELGGRGKQGWGQGAEEGPKPKDKTSGQAGDCDREEPEMAGGD